MKFPVFLLFSAQVTSHVRPSFVSHEAESSKVASKVGCCSQTVDASGTCKKRKCLGLGKRLDQTDLTCCRLSDGTPTPKTRTIGPGKSKRCQCLPAGEFPYSEDDGSAATCCSGSFRSDGRCGCIAHTEELHWLSGAFPKDCCSGKFNTSNMEKQCLPPTCTEVGDKKGKHGPCCSGQDGVGGICKCIQSGAKFPTGPGKGVKSCCSERARDGRCAHLPAGHLPSKSADKSVCSSGKLDKHGFCECVQDGDESDDEESCCSGTYEKGTRCGGCLSTGSTLQRGATGKNCCSGVAELNVCVCRPV